MDLVNENFKASRARALSKTYLITKAKVDEQCGYNTSNESQASKKEEDKEE